MCISLVCDDVEGLVKGLGRLVGVMDFTFQVEGSQRSLQSGGSATLAGADSDGDGKGKEKVH